MAIKWKLSVPGPLFRLPLIVKGFTGVKVGLTPENVFFVFLPNTMSTDRNLKLISNIFVRSSFFIFCNASHFACKVISLPFLLATIVIDSRTYLKNCVSKIVFVVYMMKHINFQHYKVNSVTWKSRQMKTII